MKLKFIMAGSDFPYVLAGKLVDDGVIELHYHPALHEKIAGLEKLCGSPLFHAFVRSQVGNSLPELLS